MKLGIVLGTRPEIIKMSPVIRAAEERDIDLFILHTGQHYSYELDLVFFEQLNLPGADHNLDVGSAPHGAQTGRMMEGIEEVLEAEDAEAVLVQGDTNTVAAGAMVAAKMNGITLGHVEAGLRSGDRSMPEEHNRVVADHLADLLFPPTSESADQLREEDIPAERIHVTGNTIVDAVEQNRHLAERRSTILEDLGIEEEGYILMTAHRQENVDERDNFQGILEGARRISAELGLPVVYPIHPRAEKRMAEFGFEGDGLRIIESQPFLDFLQLLQHAQLVLTDSGGVQEESCILGVPCVTLRENTERPETLEVGSNRLAGTDPQEIVEEAQAMLKGGTEWDSPFGDGQAGEEIVEVLSHQKRGQRRIGRPDPGRIGEPSLS